MKRLRQGAAPAVYLLGFFCDRTNRLTRNGAIAPGAEAVVELIYRKPVDDLTKLAVRAFFSIGALGFRATRTAGAITSRQYSLDEQRWEDLKRKLETAGFKVELLRDRFGTWYELVERADKLLKEKLRGRDGLRINAGRGGSRANVLGSASPRQASAVHLRPVRIGGDLRLALLEAPHQRILGRETLRAESSRGSVVEQARRANLL
ncbi:MAG: hypothetical protein N2652_11785 [Kiritimatiellae bacterium]|nr:hypothetical protein [Kiritimatiellia bacterium]